MNMNECVYSIIEKRCNFSTNHTHAKLGRIPEKEKKFNLIMFFIMRQIKEKKPIMSSIVYINSTVKL